MAINISIASDVTDVIRGAKNIGEALEDVARDLEQLEDADTRKLESGLGDAADEAKALGKAGDKAGEQLEKGLEGAADSAKDLGRAGDKAGDQVKAGLKDAGSGAESLEKKMREAFRSTADAAADSGKKIGDSQKAGLDAAGDGLEEFKGEANSTAKESAASFDGSAESIAGAFQEVAANAFAGFGPAGALAGLAAAAGIGLVIAELNKVAEKNNEVAEGAAEMGRELYEAGGELDRSALLDKVKELAFALATEDNPWTAWANEAKTGIGEVKDAIEDVKGVSDADVFKALAGDVEAGQKAFDELTDSIDRDKVALFGHQSVMQDGSVAISLEGQALEKNIKAREDLREKIEEATGASKQGSEEAAYYADVMGTSAEATDRAAESSDAQSEAMARQAEKAEAVIDAQNRLAGAHASAVEQEIRVIEGFDKLTESLTVNGATLDLNTEAGRANASALVDQVGNLNAQAQAEVDAGASVEDATGKLRNQTDHLVNQLAPAFGGSREAARLYIEKMLQVPKTVTTDVNLDGIPDAQAALNNFTSQRPTIPVLAQLAVDRQRAYNELYGAYGGHSFAVNITPRGGNQAVP